MKLITFDYRREIREFQQKGEQDLDFNSDTQIEKIKFQQIGELNLKKQLLQCSQFLPSPHYKNAVLQNALNVIQKNMSIIRCLLEQTNNYYGVWLCIQGKWQLITVDGNIPCIKDSEGQFTLATIITEYEWPIIIEKAIAKHLGKDYQVFDHLVNYSIEPFLFMLTGSQTEKTQVSSFAELQGLVKDQSEIFYVSYYRGENEICFSLLECKVQGNQELIQLRAACKDHVLVGSQQQNETIFFLKWIEFNKHFQYICSIKWVPTCQQEAFKLKYQQERKTTKFVEHTYTYKFNITQDFQYQITLGQRDQNLNTKFQDKANKYGLFRIAIFKQISEDKFEYVEGKLDNQQNITLKVQLSEGEYIFFCQGYFSTQMLFVEKSDIELTQIVYLQFQGLQVPKQVDQVDVEITKKLLISAVKQNANSENTRTYKKLGQPKIQVTTQKFLGLLIFYYLNLGLASIEETISFQETTNLINYETLEIMQNFVTQVDPITQEHLVVYCFDPSNLDKQNHFLFKYKLQITQKIVIKLDGMINPQPSIPIPELQQQPRINNPDGQINPQDASLVISSQNDQAQIDLIEFVKQQGRMQKIEPNEVYFYMLQHEVGVILLFMNQSDFEIQLKTDLELDNLYINCKKEYLSEKGLMFIIGKKQHQFIYLEVMEKNNPYQYKIEHYYCIVSNQSEQ